MKRILSLWLAALFLLTSATAQAVVCIGFGQSASLTKSDNFNRADQNPLVDGVDTSATPTGTWTEATTAVTAKIVSNQVTGTGAGKAMAYWAADTFAADQSSQITMVTNDSAFTGPTVRSATGTTNTVTCYTVLVSYGDVYLRKYVNGAQTNLSTLATGQAVNGYPFKITATGTSSTVLKVYINGTQIGSDYTDSTSPLTTGQPGIMVTNTGVIDSWIGAEL